MSVCQRPRVVEVRRIYGGGNALDLGASRRPDSSRGPGLAPAARPYLPDNPHVRRRRRTRPCRHGYRERRVRRWRRQRLTSGAAVRPRTKHVRLAANRLRRHHFERSADAGNTGERERRNARLSVQEHLRPGDVTRNRDHGLPRHHVACHRRLQSGRIGSGQVNPVEDRVFGVPRHRRCVRSRWSRR